MQISRFSIYMYTVSNVFKVLFMYSLFRNHEFPKRRYEEHFVSSLMREHQKMPSIKLQLFQDIKYTVSNVFVFSKEVIFVRKSHNFFCIREF